jgi:hypothetical protein
MMSDLVHERELERNVSDILAEDKANINKFKTAMQLPEDGVQDYTEWQQDQDRQRYGDKS